MEGSEWVPANDAEQALADALARGDGQTVAQLLESVPLLLPTPPAPGSAAESELAELILPDSPYIPVFTSPETLFWAFRDLFPAYEEVELGALLQRWPSPAHLMAVNLGSPIAVILPPTGISDLAEGRQGLVPLENVRQVLLADAQTELRRLCLQELAGEPEVSGELRPDQPVNPLEVALQEAVTHADGNAYLHALLADATVLLLTDGPVADPAAVFDEDFPWRVLGGQQARTIAVFSSPEMLDRTGATGAGGDRPDHVEIEFLHVLANWPGEDHVLCVNPGSRLELTLTGDLVLEVVADLAEAFAAD